MPRRLHSATSTDKPQPSLRADQLQDCVVSVWQQILGFDQVGLDDSFFDLGGHSLLLIQVHRELSRRLGRHISLLALFQNPTPRTLASHLSAGVAASPSVNQAKLRAERQRQALAARSPIAREQWIHRSANLLARSRLLPRARQCLPLSL